MFREFHRTLKPPPTIVPGRAAFSLPVIHGFPGRYGEIGETMLTLSRLRRRLWYKILKFWYAVAIFVSVITIFAGVSKFGKDWHGRVLPKTRQEALNDPDFYMADNANKREVLALLDPDFARLKFSEQTARLKEINSKVFLKNPVQLHCNYVGYYDWNPAKSLVYLVGAGLAGAIVFELVRRVFFFIVLGKFFP